MYHVFINSCNNHFTCEFVVATTKRSFHEDNLEPGVTYWFTVVAVGAAGASSKSEPLLARAA